MVNKMGNLPPGVTDQDIEKHVSYPCEVCSNDVAQCVCPECTVCGEVGWATCYTSEKNPARGLHGMRVTKEQVVAMQENMLVRLKKKVEETERVLAWLRKPETDPFKTEADGGEPSLMMSDDLRHHEDPKSISLMWER